MDLLKRILPLGLSLNILIAGCAGLETRLGEKASLFESAEKRNGESEDEWGYRLLTYSWKDDAECFWQPPKITIAKKSGDCEDFATLSAFYSGERYGNKILVLAGSTKDKHEPVFHAVHLLEKEGKYSSRGYHGDNIPLDCSLKDLISKIQEGHYNSKYLLFWIINLDEMNKDWRTTEKDLNEDYVRMLKDGKVEIKSIKDLR